MTQVLDAVYEKGIFRLLGIPAADLQEGQNVRISVESDSVEKLLQQAASVFADLDEAEIDEIETIALDRSSFFSKASAVG